MAHIPLKLVSEANRRDHWAVKAKRIAEIRKTVRLHLLRALGWRPVDLRDLVIILTRHSPTQIRDTDNLISAFKAVRDEIALFLGFDDSDSRVKWQYEQVKSKDHAVTVELVHRKPCRHCGGNGYT